MIGGWLALWDLRDDYAFGGGVLMHAVGRVRSGFVKV